VDRIRIVHSADDYLAALRCPPAIPLIGTQRLHTLQKIAAAYDRAIAVEAAGHPPTTASQHANPRTLAQRSYHDALEDRVPDGRHRQDLIRPRGVDKEIEDLADSKLQQARQGKTSSG
jgi:hypothetical protein